MDDDLHAKEFRDLGYSEDEVDKALADIREYTPESVKKLDLRRTEKIILGLIADGGLYEGDVRAASVAIKILDRRAKYLGLDQPDKQEVTLKSPATPADARRIMQELFGDNVRAPASPDTNGAEKGVTTH